MGVWYPYSEIRSMIIMILSVKKNNKIGIIVDAYNEFYIKKQNCFFYVCLYALYSLNIIPGI